ncbi:MAG: copper amine oxidase N-terminal domain-containing protein [Clostridiales bacterium]|jgi:hypothetical protein|nr:copper amine oxidase N-terminal domain-containing protein [Clostridiales bacterium]
MQKSIMKKSMAVLVTAALLLCAAAVNAAELPVYVDGTRVAFDVQPIVTDGCVMVPLRFVFEALGIAVNYDDETRTVSALRTDASGGVSIILIQIDNPKAFVNSGELPMERPPVEIDGRTLVPLGFIGDALGCTVQWPGDAPEENAACIVTAADE